MREIPKGWELDALGKHAIVKARIGWRGLSSSEYRNAGPFLVAGNHVESGRVNWSACDHISEYRYQESMEIALREGDLILTKDGTIGRVARIDALPGRASINGTMMLVRCLPSVDYRFTFHYLRGEVFQRLVEERISGGSIPHIFQRDMVTLPFLVPPAGEQRRIADILDAMDSSILASKEIINSLVRLRRSHVSAQVNGLGVTERLGLFVAGSPRNGIYKHQSSYGESGTPILRIDSFGAGVIFDVDRLRRVNLDEAEKAVYGLSEGDLVINRVNSIDHIGKSALVDQLRETTVFESNVMRVRVDGRILDSQYAALVLSEEGCLRHFRSRAKSAISQASINKSDVLSCPIPVPSLEKQHRMVAIIGAHDERIAVEQARLEKLRKLKVGLMDDLLTGRVRVDELKDLPV